MASGAAPPNGRRTAVRMLQKPSFEKEVSGCAPIVATNSRTPPPATPVLPPQPPSISSSQRRRSACIPFSACDEFPVPDSSASTGAMGCSTAPSSPCIPRRTTNIDGFLSGDFDLNSHYHMSVPLTLLSLHNGGGRHTPRMASHKDGATTPLASPSLLSREGSSSLSGLSDAGGAHVSNGSNVIDDASGMAIPITATGISSRRMSVDLSLAGGSPPKRCITPLTTAPNPFQCSSSSPFHGPITNLGAAASSGAAAGSACVPANGTAPLSARSNGRNSLGSIPAIPGLTAPAGGDHTQPFSTSAPLPSATSMTASATGVTGTPLSPPSSTPPATDATTAAAGGCMSNGVTLPAHLCPQRPPTPVCKEEELLVSMRHMASPTRRRSRFATATESSMLAAAAAAVADEMAGDGPLLLDASTHIGSCNGGTDAGADMAREPRSRRSGLVPIHVGTGADGGVGCCGAPGALEVMASGPSWSSAGGASSRKTASQLLSVPEESASRRSTREDVSAPQLHFPAHAASAGISAASADCSFLTSSNISSLHNSTPISSSTNNYLGAGVSSFSSFSSSSSRTGPLGAIGSSGAACMPAAGLGVSIAASRRLRMNSSSSSNVDSGLVLLAPESAPSSFTRGAAGFAGATGGPAAAASPHSFSGPVYGSSSSNATATAATAAAVAGSGGVSVSVMGAAPPKDDSLSSFMTSRVPPASAANGSSTTGGGSSSGTAAVATAAAAAASAAAGGVVSSSRRCSMVT
ncbi:hypothetical protein Agub_g7036 [Astrephomene gubernaculifera]|uniref:Uncharacterized protein n=1 Tax=Astrephomene gubernaculifera TaxID=47775 RepID=A0AAD3DPV9_9CHLO|nr:hypothetical protein Agub_g7036 [Astrephomene gubernaculifera]